MYVQVEKPKEKSRAIANSVAQKKLQEVTNFYQGNKPIQKLNIANLETVRTNGKVNVPPGVLGQNVPKHTTTKDGSVYKHKLEIDISYNVMGLKDVSLSNYRKVAQNSVAIGNDMVNDLKPNKIGKSPRTTYYSKNLLHKHEEYHYNDSIRATESKLQDLKRKSEEENYTADKFNEEVQNADELDYYGEGGRTTPHDQRPGEIRAYAAGREGYITLINAIKQWIKNESWRRKNKEKK